MIGRNRSTNDTVGLVFRRGSGGIICNAIVTQFSIGLDIDGPSSIMKANSPPGLCTNISNGTRGLTLEHSIFFENSEDFDGAGDGFDEREWALDIDRHNFLASTDAPPISIGESFQSTGPAIDGSVNVAVPPNDGFFDQNVNHIGGMGPNDFWTLGWTSER